MMDDPTSYFKMLNDYLHLQESVINEFNIPPYHFSTDVSDVEIDLIKQYQKRVRELQTDIRLVEQKKKYYETVYTQIQQENQKSKMELSRASRLDLSMTAGKDPTSQQHLLREYVVLLKRENKVLQKQIENFRNYLERNPPHLEEDPDEARRKNEIYLNSIVEKHKRKEDRLRMRLEKKERERMGKRKLLQIKKRKLGELKKLYGAKLQQHKIRLDQKKEERTELKRNIQLQEGDLIHLKQEVLTLREEKIANTEMNLKENQKKELHFLDQLSSLEKKRVELNQELTNARKKIEFYEMILAEKRQFEESRNQMIRKKFKSEEEELKKKNQNQNKSEIRKEREDQLEIDGLRKELDEKKEHLRKLKEESMARREKMSTPEEEKRFEEVLGRNRELYLKKIRLSNNLKKLEKLIKKRQMKLRILEQYRVRHGRIREKEEVLEEEEALGLETDWGVKVKKAEEEMLKEIETTTSVREQRDNEKIRAKRERIQQLTNRLNFLKTENQRFTFTEPIIKSEENEDGRKFALEMIEHKRQKEELEREREHLEGIKTRRRDLMKKSFMLKDEMKKQKMAIDEKKFKIEVLKRKVKNSQNRARVEDERVRSLLLKQENLLKKKKDVLMAMKMKDF